jgi:hypothetical protein
MLGSEPRYSRSMDASLGLNSMSRVARIKKMEDVVLLSLRKRSHDDGSSKEKLWELITLSNIYLNIFVYLYKQILVNNIGFICDFRF